MMHRRTLLAWLTLALFGLFAPASSAAGGSVRKIDVTRSGSNLLATIDYRDVFTHSIKEKLKSGLPTRVLIQINLERHGKKEPVSFWARNSSIVYDLWDEKFIVTVEDTKGKRQAKTSTIADAIKLAGLTSRSSVANIDNQEGVYRLRVTVEVNPVSKEMVQNIRQWLAKPSSSPSTPKTNFIGSFVGTFVDRRIGQADHAVQFYSQWFRLDAS